MEQTDGKPIFRPLSADDPEPEVSEIESLCMSCYEKVNCVNLAESALTSGPLQGVTRLLLTKIPFYKDIVVFSFCCGHCGYENNEIQSAAPLAEKGVRFTLTVEQSVDLNRKVVKSDYTSVRIVELDFEIPSQSQKGEITTVEGIIDRSVRGLEQDQAARRLEHEDTARLIDEFVGKLRALKELEVPFTLVLEDISGNSFVENVNAPLRDPRCVEERFSRTDDQKHALGLYTRAEVDGGDAKPAAAVTDDDFTLERLERDEVLQFETGCPSCGQPCQTNMKVTSVPHFKDVVIMATACEGCGHRTNEVKAGGGVEPRGLRIEVAVTCPADLSRDVLKSETCSLRVPELELELGPSTLGGRFTTVEGVLVAVREQLAHGGRTFLDAEDPDVRRRMDEFLERLDVVVGGGRPVTLCLDDPAGNSYVQSLAEPGHLDTRLTLTHYDRSFQQNEDLGLNDMRTEHYAHC